MADANCSAPVGALSPLKVRRVSPEEKRARKAAYMAEFHKRRKEAQKGKYKAERGPLYRRDPSKMICWLEQVCKNCKTLKSHREFGLDYRYKTPLTVCKKCKTDQQKARGPRKPFHRSEETRARDRDRKKASKKWMQPDHRAKKLESTRKWRLRTAAARGKPIIFGPPKNRMNKPPKVVAPRKPWNDPALTPREKWRMRYRMDEVFRAKEILKVQGRKAARAERIAAQSDGTVTPESLGALFAAAKSCHYCGEVFASSTDKTADHVIPLCKGGLHALSNLVIACLSCNCAKGRKSVEEWRTKASPATYHASTSSRPHTCAA